ncbi:MAG TPA: anthranilate phosphoribosyltransferase [Candidatus Polarisedimenticolia bacterium]|nr:anthranilate phosphoribosyltransferase [Candidatus Polarisedimenticolia bacterium]
MTGPRDVDDDLQAILGEVVEGRPLSAAAARAAFEAIMDGRLPPARLAALLVALRMRGETVAEITEFARVMRERCTPVRCEAEVFLDTCGTGGDGAGTFNISTVSAFVVTAAGVVVAKHGNRSVSSRCGSADLLQGLGIRVDSDVATVERSLREIGIGFLFAPSLHGAMRHAAPVRRELGVRTVFNLLGPLTNPAGARHQLLGVYDPRRLEVMAEVLRELGSVRAMVVHGDGLDEMTLHGRTRVAELKDGRVRVYELTPEDAGLDRARLEDLAGGDVAQNVGIARRILDGERGPRRDVVLLNASAALMVAGQAEDLAAGVALAGRAIDSGAASRVVERLCALCPLESAVS